MHIIEDCRDAHRVGSGGLLNFSPICANAANVLLLFTILVHFCSYDIFHTHAHCQLFRCVTETGDGELDYIADDEKCWEERTGA